jgi:hypothetical protein
MRAAVAHAQAEVTVSLNAQGEAEAARLGLTVPELIAHAEARIDELYRISGIDRLLRQLADTAAFSHRGLGAAYDVDPGDLLLGVTAAGVRSDIAIGTTSSFAGSVVSLSLLAGGNLGRWNHPRVTVFASGFYNATTLYNLEGHLLSLASHVQVQALLPSPPARARWTGVALTSGIEYTRWSIRDAGTLVSRFTARGPAAHRTVQLDSTGTLDVLTTTATVPLEVTTGVRLFGILSFYGGAGVAVAIGTATIRAELDSVLSINADHLPIGTATIRGSGENTPSALALHALAGAAIHTRHVRFVLQSAFAPGETSASIGLRGAW